MEENEVRGGREERGREGERERIGREREEGTLDSSRSERRSRGVLAGRSDVVSELGVDSASLHDPCERESTRELRNGSRDSIESRDLDDGRFESRDHRDRRRCESDSRNPRVFREDRGRNNSLCESIERRRERLESRDTRRSGGGGGGGGGTCAGERRRRSRRDVLTVMETSL